MTKVNDFVIKFANVNGSGSASANLMFAKSIFRMGIPVSPKNIFPSNIQGLPTWYEIRVNKDGYIARRDGVDCLIALNPQTYQSDLKELVEGGYLIYDSTMERKFPRKNINWYLHLLNFIFLLAPIAIIGRLYKKQYNNK